MFSSEGVTLRPLQLEDAELVYQWSQEVEADILASWGNVVSRLAFDTWFEEKVLARREGIVTFGIEVDQRLVGKISLQRIDSEQRIASLGVVVYDRTVRQKGVGRMACRILMDYGFKALNLEKVYAEAYGFNVASQRLLESVGFVKEGVLREHELHHGERHDMHFYGMLKREYYEKYETLLPYPRMEE